jgi:glycerol uptake facilitator-like aquaporin
VYPLKFSAIKPSCNVVIFGLVSTILFIRKYDEKSVAIGVALFITAGYWFTSSTSFANPAVTIARIFTDTFTGIAPISVKFFLVGQLVGSLIAHYVYQLSEKTK